MTGLVSEKRMKALLLLKEEMGVEQFAKRMWDHAVAIKFAHHFLAGLVKLGYVERKEEKDTEIYRVTGEGTEAVVRAMCAYCGARHWKQKLMSIACRTCENEHWACQRCSAEKVVVIGEFPRYRPALKGCPKKEGGS